MVSGRKRRILLRRYNERAIFGAPFAGAGPVTSTFNTAGTVGNTSGTYTVPSVTSLIVLTWGAQTSPAAEPTAVTIGGHAATKIVSNGAVTNSSAIWAAIVNPGDANTWSVTCANIFSSRCQAQLYTLTASRINATATAASTATNPTATLNVPDGSSYLGVCNAQGSTAPTVSWSLLTQDSTNSTNQHNYTCAHLDYALAANSQTATCTYTASTGSVGVFAVFSP